MNNDHKVKILIIRDLSMYFEADVLNRYDHITFASRFRRLNLLGRIVRQILMNCNIFIPRLIGQWLKELHQYDIVILFAGHSDKDLVAKGINRRLKEDFTTKLIYWYWNAIEVSTPPNYIRDNANRFSLWSFDKNDCDDYKLQFNTTFYSRFVKCSTVEKKWDIYFLGRNKGRLERIKQLIETFSNMGLTFYAYIVDEDMDNQKPLLTPKQNIENISKTSAIFDIPQEGQSGLTLRCMESLFLEKKLITTDKTIKFQHFYSPQNIFIIDSDKMDDLTTFMSEPCETIASDVVDFYDVERWVERFT